LLVELGAVAMSGQRVIDVADEFLERLSAMVQQTVVLSLWGGIGPVVAVEHVPPHQLVKISIQVGNRLPLESAQGLVFLAFMADGGRRDQLLAQLTPGERTEIVGQLEDVVATGLAINDRVTDGIRAIAAPVRDASGRICATLALVGTIHVLPADPESTAAMSLLDTARRLSVALGLTGAPPLRASNGATG
jgi:DNA-binding IclR family transcriptional regulator